MKLTFPRVGMRTIKTIVAIIIVLALGEAFGLGMPIYALFAVVLSMRETVANSVAFGIARLVSIFIGGAMGLLFVVLGVSALPPIASIPLLAAGSFAVLYITLVFKQPTSTAYALLMLFIVYNGNNYMDVLRRFAENVGGVAIAVLVNKFFGFKPLRPGEEEQQ